MDNKVERKVVSDSKKTKYYSLASIKKEHCDYNIIIGERSNGKTYACLKELVTNYVKKNEQGAYLRRWREDILGKRGEKVFAALVEDGVISKLTEGEYSTVIYAKSNWYLARYDEEKNKYIADKTPFCFGLALSDVEHDKSVSYPNVTTIVFDEFLSRRSYLVDEFIIFMNVLSTIIRQRNNVIIYMLGNTVNMYSPYFDEMGLKHISDMQQGSIDVYRYGDSRLKVAVEYCSEMEKKSSNKYFAFDNPRLNMITNGSWEIGIYPHLPLGKKIKPKDVLFRYYIVFNANIIQCNVIFDGTDYYTYCHRKTTELNKDCNNIIYTLEYDTRPNVKRNILDGSEISRKLVVFFKTAKVFYQSNEIGEVVQNYILSCKR